MGALRNIFLSAIVLVIAFSFQAYRDLTKTQPKPDLGKFSFFSNELRNV